MVIAMLTTVSLNKICARSFDIMFLIFLKNKKLKFLLFVHVFVTSFNYIIQNRVSGDKSLKIKNLTINFQLMSRQLLLLNSQNTILSKRDWELHACVCAVKFKHNSYYIKLMLLFRNINVPVSFV